MPDFLTAPVPNTEAADYIASKPIVSRDVFNGLLPDLQARAFTVTGIEAANVLQSLRDRIADLPLGADWDTVKADVAGQISPYLDSEDEGRSESRAELLLRTHGFQAYDAASTAVMDRQQAAFPYWQYQTMEDERVRDTHAALDQLVLPADSPFWDRQREWGCRCIKVALSPEDVDQMQEEDADALPEEQRVLDGDRLHDIETSGRLTRALPGDNGMPREFNVTTKDGTGRWNQTTMDMDLSSLAKRYDPETWSIFTDWAKTTDLGAGQGSVWDWLNGQAKPASTATTTPAPVAALPAVATPATVNKTTSASAQSTPAANKSPVSAALKVTTKASHASDISTAIAAIDKVHDDGALPEIPIMGQTGGSALGIYRFTASGAARDIGISKDGDWPGMTTAHEIGHLIDHQVLGTPGEFASVASPDLAEFRSAVQATAAVKEINALSVWQQGSFLQPYELWARAYAQYIAMRSGDPLLIGQLNTIRSGPQPWRQWSAEDFAPVATAIDNLFRTKGWLT